jgi:hypothetical protein
MRRGGEWERGRRGEEEGVRREKSKGYTELRREPQSCTEKIRYSVEIRYYKKLLFLLSKKLLYLLNPVSINGTSF